MKFHVCTRSGICHQVHPDSQHARSAWSNKSLKSRRQWDNLDYFFAQGHIFRNHFQCQASRPSKSVMQQRLLRTATSDLKGKLWHIKFSWKIGRDMHLALQRYFKVSETIPMSVSVIFLHSSCLTPLHHRVGPLAK